jgi:hypothetical protein
MGNEGLLQSIRSAATLISDLQTTYATDMAEARKRRATAIRAAEEAGISKEVIAAAAGLQWPMSNQRWWSIRRVG